MKLYIAGPMTGLPDFNIPRFKVVTAKLRSQGLEVVCPTECTSVEDFQAHGWDYCMTRDLTEALKADAVLLLEGWPRSRGACIEAFLFYALGRPVFEIYYDGDVIIFGVPRNRYHFGLTLMRSIILKFFDPVLVN